MNGAKAQQSRAVRAPPKEDESCFETSWCVQRFAEKQNAIPSMRDYNLSAFSTALKVKFHTPKHILSYGLEIVCRVAHLRTLTRNILSA